MTFGECPTSLAEGAVLAHSLDLPDGRLRKGQRLSADLITRLQAAGYHSLVVARPAPGNLDEDAAALALAQAVAGAGVELRIMGTGRVNLHATGAGIALLDPAAIAALNGVDEMLTLATLPAFAPLVAGQMIATVKVISYFVAEDQVRRAAQAGLGAVARAAPVCEGARLIETRLTQEPPSDKGRRSTQARLARLGLTLTGYEGCAHEVTALAQALRAAPGHEPLLILTASATSDPEDVAPAAIRAAGGRVERVGMPVDPGNLLCLGHLGERPVIALPGCARSIARNGADLVLERILCGLSVRSEEIAAMGLGGLLVEMPSRPHSRVKSTANAAIAVGEPREP